MPGKDSRGPAGQGPLTGRGMGWCGGDAAMDMQPRGRGRGAGAGRGGGGGGGGGWRHRNGNRACGMIGGQRGQRGRPAPGAGSPLAFSEEQELAALKQQAADLEQTLGEMKSRIQQIEEPAAEDRPSTENDDQ